MSFTFDVCKVGDDSYRVSGSTGKGNSRNSTQNFTQTYLVKVLGSDGNIATGNLATVSTAQVGYAPGLPIVQKSVYTDTDAGVFHPFAICMSKDVKRRREQPALFDVSCSFQATMESEFNPIDDIQQPADLSPQVVVSVDAKERVLYQDLDTKEQSYLFPGIDLMYPSPIVTQVPLLTLDITQYEEYVSYSQILERSYRVNETEWKGYPAGRWRIVVKNVSEVTVPTAGGDQTWAKVQYEAKLSADGFWDEDGNWEYTGWKQQIPLIAPKFVGVGPGNPVYKFVHEKTSEPRMGLIDEFGAEYTASDKPKYLTHTRYLPIEFDDFMQDF